MLAKTKHKSCISIILQMPMSSEKEEKDNFETMNEIVTSDIDSNEHTSVNIPLQTDAVSVPVSVLNNSKNAVTAMANPSYVSTSSLSSSLSSLTSSTPSYSSLSLPSLIPSTNPNGSTDSTAIDHGTEQNSETKQTNWATTMSDINSNSSNEIELMNVDVNRQRPRLKDVNAKFCCTLEIKFIWYANQ